MALAVQPGSYRTNNSQLDEARHYDNVAEEMQRAERRRKAIKAENLGMCRSILIFLAYLSVFTAAMFLEGSASSSRFADHIRAISAGGGPIHHRKMTLDRIAKPDDMYSFLEQIFIPSFWENNTDTNQALDMSRYLHPVDVSNRMLGSARVRQVRVQQETGCQVGPMFGDYSANCYPGVLNGQFGGSNEATNAFGPEMKYTHSEDSLGTGYSGSLGSYTSGGYMLYLSVNRTTAQIAIQEARRDKFLDLDTRAVFVDFSIWNSNLGMYAVVRASVEFGATGTVHSKLEISMLAEQMLAPGGHGNIKDWAAFFTILMIMMFVIYFLAEELQELYGDKWGYFMDGWNVLDWVNMILLIVAFAFRIMVFLDAASANVSAGALANPDAFTSLRALSAKAESVKLLHSFNAVLLWGKCVKYTKHLPIVKVLVKTIWDAFALFGPLMTMFTVALFGFTMAFNIGFGDKLKELTTFPRAIVYLSRAFLRDVKLMPVYYITPVFGAILILLFYVMLVLVGVQVLFAIVTDAMYRAKHHPEKENVDHEDEPLEEVLREGYKLFIKFLHDCCPFIYTRFVEKPLSYEERQRVMQQRKEAAEEKLALKEGEADTESSYSVSQCAERKFTTAEIMLAVQHMSGRVLSEVQEVGIEIRSELHDVCERVAQMQMAVEELSWRAELVRREQEEVMA